MDATSNEHEIRQQVPSNKHKNTKEHQKGVRIFFKIRNLVRKSWFDGDSVEELKNLFIKKFQWESENEFGFTRESLPPFWVEHPTLKIKYELDDVSDLYNDCIVEVLHTSKNVSEPRADHSTILKNFGNTHDKLVIVMVGLPARGKTHIARKVARYLNWVGVPCRVFNVGQYRRSRLGAQQPHNFFDPENEEARKKRLHMAIAALDDMIEWLMDSGYVGIYDATNTTKARRNLIVSRCEQEQFKVMFIESIVEDYSIVERNIRQTKVSSPDYEDVDPDQAIEDFRSRIGHYEKVYEPLDDDDKCYIKVIDIGRKIILNRVDSYLPSRIVFFLMNLHNTPRNIYLTRHGETEFNAAGIIGGDSSLTNAGDDYAHILAEWAIGTFTPLSSVTIFTSTLRRTIQTTQYIPSRKIRFKALDEIDAGDYDGMTYKEVADRFPEEYKARSKDKLRYRYPRGESYLDVIQRLEPIIFEVERQKKDLIIVAHQAVLRCIYAYLVDLQIEECPYIQIPLHTIIKLSPSTYFCEEERIKLKVEHAHDFAE